ncbi:MAG: hypothetical protein EBT98_01935 [Opitutaceae bacterium]|jgi:hypothetical protein|nr:hypothetical protein [Opitutae bacterium]NBR08394.1 hypothetical protein [Opitutaceae bacterium]NBR59291.1 hypothetical protein [Opitutaceae bacterium]
MAASVSQSDPLPTPAARWLAALCALAIWLLGLLNASPQLHGSLHHDGNQADHTCAITLFSHGVEATAVQVDLTLTPQLILLGAPVSPLERSGVNPDRLPPACGPPSALS